MRVANTHTKRLKTRARGHHCARTPSTRRPEHVPSVPIAAAWPRQQGMCCMHEDASKQYRLRFAKRDRLELRCAVAPVHLEGLE